ncbi:hypothetical protein I8748_17800 [Nostoc sp. CENA67]|uniref:Uncharacterized protein n=1 Tax=Amazonocrinis nigriterrae CENA67 TaxID=2794033 RepID=A0A8J7LAF2_9NOST|nr:hypothetical protein [Amazonocrinis nigriterrae]MBH8564016.1 hypothetical protein [Amazonocrinis nigriterrae CENA67]
MGAGGDEKVIAKCARAVDAWCGYSSPSETLRERERLTANPQGGGSVLSRFADLYR